MVMAAASCPSTPLRALEFYSGLGGLHYAAMSALPAGSEVVEAFDINDTANDVYQHNFGRRPYQGNIEALTCRQLDKYQADLWLLSPPCQPYTRQGHQKQSQDHRAASFITLLSRLAAMKHQPRYLLLENVVGFECSDTHQEMLHTLHQAGYHTQGFILTPSQYGLPYSRPRYFCLGSKRAFKLQPSDPDHQAAVLDQSKHHVFHDPPYALLDRQGGGPGHLQEVPALGHFLLSQPCPTADTVLHSTGNAAGQSQPALGAVPSSTQPADVPATEAEPGGTATPNSQWVRELVQASVPEQASTSSCAVPASQDQGVSAPDSTHCAQHACERAQHRDGQAQQVCQHAQHSGGHGSQQGWQVCAGVDPWHAFLVPDRFLAQSGDVLDVVTSRSNRCKTFTKNYSQYMKGTGSLVCMAAEYQDPELCTREAVFQRALARTPQHGDPSVAEGGSHAPPQEPKGSSATAQSGAAQDVQGVAQDVQGVAQDVQGSELATTVRATGSAVQEDGEEEAQLHPLAPKLDKRLMADEWRRMALRYFTPREVARLHGLPHSFAFPPHLSLRARYQLLGNSLCVPVVADLIKYLMLE